MTPDPYKASGGLGDPQSWNQYDYTRGDPVNRYDPAGLDDEPPSSCDPSNPNCTGLFTCPDGTVVLIGGLCPSGSPVQAQNQRQPGQSTGCPPTCDNTPNSNIRGVTTVTNNDGCANEIGFSTWQAAVGKLNSIQIDDVALKFQPT